MAPDKAKAPEKPGPSEDQPIAEADAGDESGSDSEAEVPTAASAESGPSRPSKKKKKRSKVSRAISALKGDSVPQAVVDQVVAKVKEEHGEDSPAADEETVRQLLKQLKLKDVAEGKAGFGGKHRKDAGDHKVRHSLHRVFPKTVYEFNGISSGRCSLSLTLVRRVPTLSLSTHSLLILGQAIVPPKKTGASSHRSPEKRSGKNRTHCQRISSGVSTISMNLLPAQVWTPQSHIRHPSSLFSS
jgi:hypothetical protein